jgi:2-dehydropantoate 2-reductase
MMLLSILSTYLSLQNGVSNAMKIQSLIPNEVFPTVLYVAVEMSDNVSVKHHGRGDIVIGSLSPTVSDSERSHLTILSDMFASSGISCVVSPKIKNEMWFKFLCNCTFNAISAIGQIEYGKMYSIPQVKELIEGITKEFVLIAAKEGVDWSFEEAMKANDKIFNTMPTQKSSTAQDLARGRISEIDHLNGYVVECGKKHNIPVPFNQTVYALVKMIESSKNSC